MKNIGPELNRIMTERRIVRKDIAKEVGITPTYLSAIVRKNSIDCELLDKICKAIGISASYFFDIEQTRLRLRYFNVKNCTLTIPSEDSKNRTTQTITIPKKVMMFMLDLGVFDYPPHYFLFSNNIMPGNVQVDRRLITIRWTRLKKELKLDKDYTFYSLKDTGITEMLDKKLSNISVRDQARHSSLAVTDVYTRHRDNADKAILDLDGTL